MNLYNTFSQKKEIVNLKQKIGIYVCGVTPYDTTHLGHAFTFVVYDALIRYLRHLGANVTYVQNVTDIDDDILIKSRSLGISWKKLGQDETKKHIKNMEALNIQNPDFFPKATENINEIIKIIKQLILKKLAYIKSGSVYFSIKKDKNFGKLSKYGYPAMLEIANERGNYPLDPNKNDPLDFILWQAKIAGEPSWPSPWGDGRPGWHIECSAMSMRYLGPTFTIHGGGSDLIFPHHEAEIAQSESITGKKFVKIWMHTAMVYYKRKKMSKSLGNMVFISDLIKSHDPNTIRILLLRHHYRNPWDFEEKELNSARKISELFRETVSKQAASKQKAKEEEPFFFEKLHDDFQTDKALEYLQARTVKKEISADVLNTCLGTLGISYQKCLKK